MSSVITVFVRLFIYSFIYLYACGCVYLLVAHYHKLALWSIVCVNTERTLLLGDMTTVICNNHILTVWFVYRCYVINFVNSTTIQWACSLNKFFVFIIVLKSIVIYRHTHTQACAEVDTYISLPSILRIFLGIKLIIHYYYHLELFKRGLLMFFGQKLTGNMSE